MSATLDMELKFTYITCLRSIGGAIKALRSSVLELESSGLLRRQTFQYFADQVSPTSELTEFPNGATRRERRIGKNRSVRPSETFPILALAMFAPKMQPQLQFYTRYPVSEWRSEAKVGKLIYQCFSLETKTKQLTTTSL